MSDTVIFSNDALTAFVIFGILGLIFMFLLKLNNVLHHGDYYEIQKSVLTLAVGTICYIFIEIGVMINFTQDTTSVLLEYNMYFWFARIFIILLWFLWFVELIFYAAQETIEPLTRMTKRRNERFNRYP